VLTSSAQLIVPVAAILSLLIFGEGHGVQAVMMGMVAGQLLNLLIVHLYLKRQDVSLWASLGSFRFARSSGGSLTPLLGQYLPLVASAFFISAAALVSSMLAMSLPEGAVSAFNLGNKVVLFVTGLVGTAMTAVMLPYFSAMVSKNHLVTARRELSLFLLFATFVSVPVSAGMYIWAEPIIRLAFEGGTFGNDSTAVVTRVMQYSVVQLPFFICNALLLKFATATRHVIAISAVAIVGLVVNVVACLLLMRHMGVAGIALGMSISMLVSTVLLTLVLVRYWHITWFDAVVMLMNWLLYGTLLIGVHFGSTPSIVVTIIAYLVLLAGYFKSWSFDEPSRIGVRT
jgi:putative peptidoglycan lipid II flippase